MVTDSRGGGYKVNRFLSGSGSMLERFAREVETLWQHINIACGRFQANITYNTEINPCRRNECLPEKF